MPPQLTPAERLALIARLDSQEAGRRGKASRMAWGSVAAAALVLVALVFGARHELVRVQGELEATVATREQVAAEIRDLNASKTKIESELAASQAKLSASLGVLGQVGEAQRRAAVDKQIAADPKTAQLLPRVYLQIVDPADREWATEVGRKLESAGVIALGVEYVKNIDLKASDVRYYKKAEKPGAEQIRDFLDTLGVAAKLNYLAKEDSTRSNHFEVWFAAGARNLEARKPG